jgi:bifunctional non-homologous end joining protein LigD
LILARSLDVYRAKRDFTVTPEPRDVDSRPIKPSDHLRFVIQKHDATRLHYDLRLELNGTFKSWAVTRGPSLDPNEKRLAVEVEDHPLQYGDFEGTIPEGEYGGGTVMIWDRGFWAAETTASPEKSLRDGELKFILAGEKLQGSWVLVRMKTKPGDKHSNWLLVKHRDTWATPGQDGILDRDKSVASGRPLSAIAAGKGTPPEPFMTVGAAADAAAVWDTKVIDRKRQRALAATAPSTVATMPRLTHPERVFWPDTGLTKRDLAEYLIAVAPWMMSHIYGRPCSIIRAPDGIDGETFFQRHAMAGLGTPKTVVVDGKSEPYLQIDDAQTLVATAQMSALEFHPWNCAPFMPEVPGRLVFDLDPAPDVPFTAVIAAATEVKDRLTKLGLVAFCKTTGGKGLHVVTPLTPDEEMSWPHAKLFAQTVCAQMAADSPNRYVTKMTKKLRSGRIYLDYLRNDMTATAVAPLSPRARPGAPVSMPLTWSQVRNGLDSGRFTVATVPKLLAKSTAWSDYGASARPLKEAVLKLVGGSP